MDFISTFDLKIRPYRLYYQYALSHESINMQEDANTFVGSQIFKWVDGRFRSRKSKKGNDSAGVTVDQHHGNQQPGANKNPKWK